MNSKLAFHSEDALSALETSKRRIRLFYKENHEVRSIIVDVVFIAIDVVFLVITFPAPGSTIGLGVLLAIIVGHLGSSVLSLLRKRKIRKRIAEYMNYRMENESNSFKRERLAKITNLFLQLGHLGEEGRITVLQLQQFERVFASYTELVKVVPDVIARQDRQQVFDLRRVFCNMLVTMDTLFVVKQSDKDKKKNSIKVDNTPKLLSEQQFIRDLSLFEELVENVELEWARVCSLAPFAVLPQLESPV